MAIQEKEDVLEDMTVYDAVCWYCGKCGTTAGLSCTEKTPLSGIAQFEIMTGPEVLAGSPRMKAGTEQKMVLNMISTDTMTKLGKVYGNIMDNVRATNQKVCEQRAVEIVMHSARTSKQIVKEMIEKVDGIRVLRY